MPSALRLLHLVGIFCLGLMLWSGLLIYWAHDPYRITVFGYEVFHFFPKGFYQFFGAEFKLAQGMGWHFAIQWLFMANGLLYVGWLALSGHWRDLAPTRLRVFADAWLVTLHDLGLRKTAPAQQGRYNAAQRLAYASVPLLGAAASLSGWAMYKPVQLGWLTGLFGSYENARLVHFATALAFTGFVVIHVAQVLRQALLTGWAHLGAMFLGTPDPATPPAEGESLPPTSAPEADVAPAA